MASAAGVEVERLGEVFVVGLVGDDVVVMGLVGGERGRKVFVVVVDLMVVVGVEEEAIVDGFGWSCWVVGFGVGAEKWSWVWSCIGS